jgi:hypothetical protein
MKSPKVFLRLMLALMLVVGNISEGSKAAQQTGGQGQSDSGSVIPPKQEKKTKADGASSPPAPTSKPAATTASPSAPASKPMTTQQAAQPKSAGMVWVNTDSGVYHKPGTRWYGKTKNGKYMTQADAVKAGYHASKKE